MMLAALSFFLVVSGPLPLRNDLLPVASPAIAMARDQRGVAVAWTMRNADGLNRIYVSRVDANGDVAGVSLDAQGNVSPFSVAATSADERDPSVIAVRPGLFFVAYEKISGTDRRIAGEFITFDGRQRPVR